MNYSMFLPQMAETDTFGTTGEQIDDVNSVVEYVMVHLGYDKTADDEDDDSGQNFMVAKTIAHFYHKVSFEIELQKFTNIEIPAYFEHREDKIRSIKQEIFTPPPEV